MERKPPGLVVGVLHRKIGNGHHEYEIAIGNAGELKKRARDSAFDWTITSAHGLNKLTPEARSLLQQDFRNNLQTEGKKTLKCGSMRLAAIGGNPGQRIGFAHEYYPKELLEQGKEIRGLGALFEHWCLEHFEKSEKVTHMTTSEGLRKLLDNSPALRKAISGLPDTLTTNKNRKKQLRKRGIDPLAITPVKEWKRRISKDTPLVGQNSHD